MADGFLGRWSRRKQEVDQGLEPVEPKPSAAPRAETQAPVPPPAAEPAAPPPADSPAPTMQDVQSLTRQSDYKNFVARDVAPEVRNAAMKKLFTDPHFNKIDWLDVYMDDYSIPSPLPAAMLKKMASAKFMKIVEDEPEAEPAAAALPDNESQSRVSAATQEPHGSAAPVAADAPPELSGPAEASDSSAAEPMNKENHDNTDLRLQQDHAAGPQGLGGGAG
ncbi:MAG: DUF3306 domain-containing protein [Hylemonella sp.]|nr:DUF3306 domain-containing protein [Hylemonella sp.]